jgi:hypothetical protein
MAWKRLFQHMEGLPMDDYYEFRCAHEIQIEKWRLYSLKEICIFFTTIYN